MDETVTTGGIALHFTRARMIADPEGLPVFEFEIQAPPGISGFRLFSWDASMVACEYDPSRGLFLNRVTLKEMPTQPLCVSRKSPTRSKARGRSSGSRNAHLSVWFAPGMMLPTKRGYDSFIDVYPQEERGCSEK